METPKKKPEKEDTGQGRAGGAGPGAYSGGYWFVDAPAEESSPNIYSPPETFSGIDPELRALILPELERLLSKKKIMEMLEKGIELIGEKEGEVNEQFVNHFWELVIGNLDAKDIKLTDEVQLKASIRRKIARAYNSIQMRKERLRKEDNKQLIPVESLLYDIVTQPSEERGAMKDDGQNKYTYIVQIKKGDGEEIADESSSPIDKIQTFDTNIKNQLLKLKHANEGKYVKLISELNEHEISVSCFDGDHDANSGIITLSRTMLEEWDNKRYTAFDGKIPGLDVKKIHREIKLHITEMERLLTNAGIHFAPEEVKNFVWEQVDPTLLRNLQVTKLGDDSIIFKNCVHDSSKYMLLTLFDTFAGAIDRGSRKVYGFERIPFSIYNFEIYGVNVILISGMEEDYYIITQMKSDRWRQENSFFTVSHIIGGGISQKDAVEIVNMRLEAASLPPSGIQARNEGDEEDCESSSKPSSIGNRFSSLCEVIMSTDEFFTRGFELLKQKRVNDFKAIMDEFNKKYDAKKFRENVPTSWHYILAYFSYKGMGDESAAAVAFDSSALEHFKKNLTSYIEANEANEDSNLALRIRKCQEGLGRKGYEFEDTQLISLLTQFEKYLQHNPSATIDQITSTLDTYISGVNRANYLSGFITKPISTLLTSRVGINFSGSSEIPEEAKRMQEKIRGLNHLVLEKEDEGQGKGLQILRKVFMEDVLEHIQTRKSESLFLQLISQLGVIERRIQSWDIDARGWIARSIEKYREMIAEGVQSEEAMKSYLESSEINENISRLLDLGGIAGDICGEMDDYGEDSILEFVKVTGTSRTRNFSIPSYDDESLELELNVSNKLREEIDLYNFEVGDDSDLRLELCEKSGKIRFKPSIEFLLNLWKVTKKRKEEIQYVYVNSSGVNIPIDNFFIQLLIKRIQSKYGEIDEGKLFEILSKLPEFFDRNFGGGIYETPQDKATREEMRKKLLDEELNSAKQAFTSEVEQVNGGGGGGLVINSTEAEKLAAQGLDSGRGGVAFNPEEESSVYNPMHVEKIPEESAGNAPKKRKYEKKSAPQEAPQEAPPAPQEAQEAPPAPQPAAQPVLEPWYKRLRLRNPFSRKGGKGGKKINRKTIKKNNSKLMKKSQKRKTIKKRNSKSQKRKTIKKRNSKSKKRKTIKKHKSKSMKKLTRRYKK